MRLPDHVRRLRLAWMADICTILLSAVAMTVQANDLRCPFQLRKLDAPGLIEKADLTIAAWRTGLKANANDPAIRQAMADYAINLLQRSNRLDAADAEESAASLRRYVLKMLPDTDWRIRHQASLGDLGAIESRLAWLRADSGHDSAQLCKIAAEGARLGGAESNYRLALCSTVPDQALRSMQRAAELGHPAAMEAVGRLCLAGKAQPGCSLDGLCRAAQSGRIEAAAAIGWRLTEMDQASTSEGAAWLQHAAQAGHALAQNNLGEWHERQNTTPAGRQMALMWYRRSASRRLPAAMVNAARLLATEGPEQCLEAGKYLKEAEQAGLPQAAEWHRLLVCDEY